MAKFYKPIGFSERKQVEPGVWEDVVTEHHYYGEVVRFNTNWRISSDSTNDDLNLDSQLSILANDFAYQNILSMKYIEFMGVKWKITKVEPRRPRLILTIGGVFNG